MEIGFGREIYRLCGGRLHSMVLSMERGLLPVCIRMIGLRTGSGTLQNDGQPERNQGL